MKRDELLNLESTRDMPKGVSPHSFIIRLHGRTCVDLFGRYWPARIVIAGMIMAIAGVCILARLLGTSR